MDDDADRASILSRRSAFIAAALAGLVGAASDCGGKVVFVGDDGTGAQAPGGGGEGGGGGIPQPCLGVPLGGGGEGGAPRPCLDAPFGGGGFTGGTGGSPCLAPPP